MSTHLPPAPAANRSPQGPVGAEAKPSSQPVTKGSKNPHSLEQGDTANVRQNTTNKNSAGGRRGG